MYIYIKTNTENQLIEEGERKEKAIITFKMIMMIPPSNIPSTLVSLEKK